MYHNLYRKVHISTELYIKINIKGDKTGWAQRASPLARAKRNGLG